MKLDIILKSIPLDITTNLKEAKPINNISTQNIVVTLHYDNIDIQLTFYATLEKLRYSSMLDTSIKSYIEKNYNDPYLYENLNKFIINKILSYQ